MADVSPFKRAVDTLSPGASNRTIAALLDHKVTRQVAGHWYAGRREVPKWAMDLLAAKCQASASPLLILADQLKRAPERLGKRAGTRNLMAWRAANSR